MKSTSIDWSSLLIASGLAFAFALSPLVAWIYGALRLPADPFSEVAYIASFTIFFMALRVRRDWLEMPDESRQGGVLLFVAAQSVRFALFWMVLGGGIALLFLGLGNWMRNAEFWGALAMELLSSLVLFKGATLAADAFGDLLWRNVRIEKTRVPDGAALTGLKRPFVAGSAPDGAQFVVAIIAALGAVGLLVYAFTFAAARVAGNALPAPTWAIVGGAMLLVALRCWWECRPVAQIGASQVRPRAGRAFAWWDIACVEESRVARFMEGDEMRLTFHDARGKILGQLPLDKLERGEKRELWRLFPESI